MAAQQILHGGRAQILVNGKIVGLFTSCTWSQAYDLVPSFILGRMSPAELTYTGSEPVPITCSGLRIIDAGPYGVVSFPRLQDLFAHEEITLAVSDRQTGKTIATITGVRPASWGTGVAARSLSDLTIQLTGLVVSDESGENAEAPGASTLDSGR